MSRKHDAFRDVSSLPGDKLLLESVVPMSEVGVVVGWWIWGGSGLLVGGVKLSFGVVVRWWVWGESLGLLVGGVGLSVGAVSLGSGGVW